MTYPRTEADYLAEVNADIDWMERKLSTISEAQAAVTTITDALGLPRRK